MCTMRRVITAFLLCLVISASARGQADPCRQRSVPISVIDEQGKPLHGLAATDFSAKFKGKQVRILSAQEDSHPPRVVVVLDSSGSMTLPEFKWRLALRLASEVLTNSPAHFHSGLIVFNDQIRVALPVQVNPQPARDALQALPLTYQKSDKTVGGRTALLDALMAAARMFDPPQFGDSIYVITDGSDNHSDATTDDVRAALARRGIRLFAEWFGTEVRERMAAEEVDARGLLDVVNDSGGLSLTVPLSPLLWEESSAKNHKISENVKQFMAARGELFSLIQSPYRLEIELPEPVQKLQKWNLTLLHANDQHTWLRLLYPKRLDACTSAATVPQ